MLLNVLRKTAYSAVGIGLLVNQPKFVILVLLSILHDLDKHIHLHIFLFY